MIVAVNVIEDIKELEANPSLRHFLGAVYEYDSVKKREVQVSSLGYFLLFKELADIISLPFSSLSILRRRSYGI